MLGNGVFQQLEHIELAETIESHSKRNVLRREFAEKGIKLILSDRQREEDEPTYSDEDDSD